MLTDSHTRDSRDDERPQPDVRRRRAARDRHEPDVRRRRAERDRDRSFWRELPVLVIVAIAVAVLIKTFLIQAFYIPSGSMENTLLINDRILVSKFAYDFSTPKPGQIVVFVAPPLATELPPPPAGFQRFVNTVRADLGLPSTSEDYIKRVVAVAGDTVEIRNARLSVNGHQVSEPYLDANARQPTSMTDYGPYVVPAHDIFVMGDNRGDSQDSRYFGAIPVSSVVGQAIVRLWPVNRLRVF
ncbi:MAG TPA: signal peptidase I [Actinomycetota bacterium]|nr:signal peptidase I [Actinomycetota bacterium]